MNKIACQVIFSVVAIAGSYYCYNASSRKATGSITLPPFTEHKDLKKQIDSLLLNYLKSNSVKANPLTSSIGSFFVLQRVIWASVTSAIEHFPDKTKLKTFTAYASGHLSLEYLLLKALALAGFNIKVINIADRLYPFGFFEPGSSTFIEKKASFITPISKDDQIRDLLFFFRSQFMSMRLNIFQEIIQHTFACLDDPKNLTEVRSDLVFMANFQLIKNIDPRYKILTERYHKDHIQFKNDNFEFVSLANTQKDALIVEVRAGSVLTFIFPLPSGELTRSIHVITAEADMAIRIMASLEHADPYNQELHKHPEWILEYLKKSKLSLERAEQLLTLLPSEDSNKFFLAAQLEKAKFRLKQAEFIVLHMITNKKLLIRSLREKLDTLSASDEYGIRTLINEQLAYLEAKTGNSWFIHEILLMYYNLISLLKIKV